MMQQLTILVNKILMKFQINGKSDPQLNIWNKQESIKWRKLYKYNY